MTAEAPPIELNMIPARVSALPVINALIARSKAHWTWPEGYLEQALKLHIIDAHYLLSNLCFEIVEKDQQPIAFLSVVRQNAYPLLDNLWVSPEVIGRGVGRRACMYLFDLAGRHGWTTIEALPDPPAAAFYGRMGFVDTGQRVASRIPGGPVFPRLRWSAP